MTGLLNHLLQCFSVHCIQRTPTRATASATSPYEDIELSVRTGDILLFNDDSRLPDQCHMQRCAAYFTRILAALPCTMYAAESAAADSDDDIEERYGTPRAQYRPVLHAEWLDWQHAVLIVCMSAPGGSEESAVPFVFFANITTGVFDLLPLRDFVQRTAAGRRTTFALRHLIINEETQTGQNFGNHRRLFSQRRAYLRDAICKFQQEVYQLSKTVVDTQRVYAAFGAALFPETRPALPNLKPDSKRDPLLLMRGSTAYTTLRTLYEAQVINVEPRVIDAAQLMQERNAAALRHHLKPDYHFTDERLFIVDPPTKR